MKKLIYNNLKFVCHGKRRNAAAVQQFTQAHFILIITLSMLFIYLFGYFESVAIGLFSSDRQIASRAQGLCDVPLFGARYLRYYRNFCQRPANA